MNHIYRYKKFIPETMLLNIADFVAYNRLADKVSYGPGENTQCLKLILDSSKSCADEAYLKISQATSKFLFNFIHQYVIPKLYPLRYPALETIELRQMLGPTREHSDGVSPKVNANGISYRVASQILTVSESNDEIVFPSQSFKTSLDRGDVLVFPPYWTHSHSTVSKAPGRISIVSHLRETAPHSERKETLCPPIDFFGSAAK